MEIDLLRVRFYVRGLHAARAMATLTAMLSVLVESFYPGLVASHKVLFAEASLGANADAHQVVCNCAACFQSSRLSLYDVAEHQKALSSNVTSLRCKCNSLPSLPAHCCACSHEVAQLETCWCRCSALLQSCTSLR